MTDEIHEDEMLRELQRQTGQLPREIAPPDAAWTRIREQIDAESQVVNLTARPVTRVWERPAYLAAAAVLLVAATSIATVTMMNRQRTQPLVTQSPERQVNGSPATLAQFTAIENDYIANANRLSAIIENGQAELAPGTIAKLKESLRVIDAAILEARRALAADPSNKALMEILATSYGQKVDLLQRAAEMGRS